jgi:hypothetical protein
LIIEPDNNALFLYKWSSAGGQRKKPEPC